MPQILSHREATMSNTDTSLNIWNMMDMADKKLLMHEFLLKNNDRFNRDEFLKFLADQCEEDHGNAKSVIILEQA